MKRQKPISIRPPQGAIRSHVLPWRMALAAGLTALLPQMAYAGTPMAEVLCFVLYDILMGTAGQGMATIGVSAVGVAALMGKASWGLALTVGVGIAVLFGCVEIVATLGLGAATC